MSLFFFHFLSVEFRSVVHHYYLLKKGPTEIHNLMIETYGNAAPTLSFVKKWLRLFQDDLPRSGRPVDQKNIEIVQKCKEDYPSNSARAISSSTGLSINTVIAILTDVLKRKKRHAKLIPHCLTNQ